MTNKILLAKTLAECLHSKQSYDDKDYIYHIENAVNVLLRFKIIDENIIITTYLHDTVEDTQMTFSLIKKYFGEEVCEMVNCVTSEIGLNRKERNLKTYQKLATNKKAIIVKLADRIANVEHSLKKQNTKFIQMYKDEYSSFRYYLKSEDNEMWDHLDKLMA